MTANDDARVTALRDQFEGAIDAMIGGQARTGDWARYVQGDDCVVLGPSHPLAGTVSDAVHRVLAPLEEPAVCEHVSAMWESQGAEGVPLQVVLAMPHLTTYACRECAAMVRGRWVACHGCKAVTEGGGLVFSRLPLPRTSPAQRLLVEVWFGLCRSCLGEP